MKVKYEVVLRRPNGTEKVLHKNLSFSQANELFYEIDNTYIRQQAIEKKVIIKGDELTEG